MMDSSEIEYSEEIASRHEVVRRIGRALSMSRRDIREGAKTNPHFADLAKEKIELERHLRSVWELSEIHWHI